MIEVAKVYGAPNLSQGLPPHLRYVIDDYSYIVKSTKTVVDSGTTSTTLGGTLDSATTSGSTDTSTSGTTTTPTKTTLGANLDSEPVSGGETTTNTGTTSTSTTTSTTTGDIEAFCKKYPDRLICQSKHDPVITTESIGSLGGASGSGGGGGFGGFDYGSEIGEEGVEEGQPTQSRAKKLLKLGLLFGGGFLALKMLKVI